AVVGRAIPADPLTNVKAQTLRGQRNVNTAIDNTLSAGDLAIGTITGEVSPLNGVAVGNLALGTIGTANIANGQVTFEKLGLLVQDRITTLETGLAAEIVNRKADVDQEESDRKADVDLEESDRKADVDLETSDRITDVNAEESARVAAVTAEQVARILDVDTEEAARIAAMNAEILARSTADSTLTTNLNAEIAARIAKDTLQDTAATSFQTALKADDISALLADQKPNDNDGFVHWNNLEGVPNGFADGIDDDGNGKVQDLKNELDGTPGDTTANDGGDPVSFTKVKDIPLGIIDQVAKDVQCTVACIGNAELEGSITADKLAGGITGGQITDGSITAADLAGSDDVVGTPANEFVEGAVTTPKLAAGAVSFSKLDASLQGRLTTLESEMNTAQADIDAVELRLGNLASAPVALDLDRVNTQRLTGQTTNSIGVDPAAVPPATRLAVAFPLVGVSAGDIVSVSPPALLNDDLLFVGSDVLLPDVVTVYLYNPTAAPIDDALLTWTVRHLDLTP
ncbi:MAG: hypothetical protein M3Q68_09370, partial [Actinomycetota bacterium]|nr:hypothetical protein [Actinomycetota bacterium]